VSLGGNAWKINEPGTATSRNLDDDGFLTTKTKRPALAMASFSLVIFVFTLHAFYFERSS
jgi:hypothetical protein